MHYSVLAILPKPEEGEDEIDIGSIEERVEKIMERHGDGDKWDWYQIGGRWTGLFDGYDPEKDPANLSTCELCSGTGKREPLPDNDFAWCGGCNGCQGTGKKVSWPTEWKTRAGDVLPTAQLTEDLLTKFYAVVTEYGWHGGEEYIPWEPEIGKRFQKRDKPPLEWLKQQGELAVVVDCHN